MDVNMATKILRVACVKMYENPWLYSELADITSDTPENELKGFVLAISKVLHADRFVGGENTETLQTLVRKNTATENTDSRAATFDGNLKMLKGTKSKYGGSSPQLSVIFILQSSYTTPIYPSRKKKKAYLASSRKHLSHKALPPSRRTRKKKP